MTLQSDLAASQHVPNTYDDCQCEYPTDVVNEALQPQKTIP